MVDYEKYLDVRLKQRPVFELDDLEKEYIETEAEREARNILSKLTNKYGAQFSRSVAMKAAANVLKNEIEVKGDNEPTGLHVSNGSTDLNGQPGTPQNLVGARAFVTQQHGKNQVWEIVKGE